jgi:quercetin dioxygenase-like cupin family protein
MSTNDLINKDSGDESRLEDETFAALAETLVPIAPSPERSRAIYARTLERIRAATGPAAMPPITIRASGDGWVELLPKIHAKLLATDGTAQSYLVRLEPGARAPAHDHPDSEECIVLEGSIEYVGGARLNAGDYQAMRKGAHHTELVSETGALVFLRYARPVTEYIAL